MKDEGGRKLDLAFWLVTQQHRAKDELVLTLTESPIVRFTIDAEPYAVFYGSARGVDHVAKHFPYPSESEQSFIDRLDDLHAGDTVSGDGHIETERWKTEGGKKHSACVFVFDILREPLSARPPIPGYPENRNW